LPDRRAAEIAYRRLAKVVIMTERLAPGDTAPAFTLTDADGQQISLADYAGGKVIVYFYPAAMTPGCTTQAVDFTAAVADLDSAGLAVVGISPDSPEKLAQFKAAQSVAFPLLADPDKKVLMAYAAYGSKMLYGKLVEGVIRSTFVVDVAEDGTGTVDVAQYNVKATGHVDKLKRDLKI
jgi:peroxiredoxin Q/BCP